MVAWFTVVVEANCIRLPVSLLFPHSGIRKRGGNDKETTCLQLASDMPRNQGNHSVVKATNLFFSVLYSCKLLHEKQESGFARLQLLDVLMDKI